jgi:hypothetical protein
MNKILHLVEPEPDEFLAAYVQGHINCGKGGVIPKELGEAHEKAQ